MTNTADIVVIGAGVQGASLAYYLARAGAGKIVLLEKTYIAGGPTGKSGAMQKIVTTCQEHNVPVGLQSGSLDFPRKWMRRGCRYIMLGNDMLCLSLEAARRLEVVKSEIGKIEST